mgnify:CR=1 FL=1
MVKNTGGNRTKGKARKHTAGRKKTLNIDDLRKIDGQEYAHVTKKYGGGRYELMCYDKIKRMGIMCGRLKRYARLEQGGFVLVSLRGFQEDKCDIIEVYKPEDADRLVSVGEVNEFFVKEGKLIESALDRDIAYVNFGNATNDLDETEEQEDTAVNWLEDDDGGDYSFHKGKDEVDIGINIDDI